MPDLRDLFRTGDHSDLQIKCNGKNFKVHKGVLTAQSEYFTRVLASNFKASRLGVINFEDSWATPVMKAALEYLYSGTYSPLAEEDADEIRIAEYHVQVFKLGKCLVVDQLEQLAVSNFERQWDRLRAENTAGRNEFLKIFIENAYSMEPKEEDPLRKSLVKMVYHNGRGFSGTGNLKKLLKDFSEFALDLANMVLEDHSKLQVGTAASRPHKLECPGCHQGFTMDNVTVQELAGKSFACPACHLVYMGEDLQ